MAKIELSVYQISPTMENIIAQIREELITQSDEKTRATSQKFFKEKIMCHGVKMPVVTRIGKTYIQAIAPATKQEIFSLCDALWQSGYIEESFIACNWSHNIHKRYEREDFQIFEKWVFNYVNNWASCDTLCNHTVGTFIQMFPEYLTALKEWAVSDNRWVRRAAAVSLIIPAREGKYFSDILEIADILLLDTDDLVRKGYGWMLKAASQSQQQSVFDYVIKNKSVMPRTSLRYAIEKMPQELKAKAMAK